MGDRLGCRKDAETVFTPQAVGISCAWGTKPQATKETAQESAANPCACGSCTNAFSQLHRGEMDGGEGGVFFFLFFVFVVALYSLTIAIALALLWVLYIIQTLFKGVGRI